MSLQRPSSLILLPREVSQLAIREARPAEADICLIGKYIRLFIVDLFSAYYALMF